MYVMKIMVTRVTHHLEFLVTELNRRVANVIRIGRVHSVDFEHDLPKVKVSIGELTTAWLPFIVQRAGEDRTWFPIAKDEQVLVISPSGELAQGVVIGSIFYRDYLPPSTSENIVRTQFSDGAVIEYDKENHRLFANLPDQGRLNVIANGGVTIDGDVTVVGNITATEEITDHTRSMQADREIYNQHRHAGVTPGSGITQVTQQNM